MRIIINLLAVALCVSCGSPLKPRAKEPLLDLHPIGAIRYIQNGRTALIAELWLVANGSSQLLEKISTGWYWRNPPPPTPLEAQASIALVVEQLGYVDQRNHVVIKRLSIRGLSGGVWSTPQYRTRFLEVPSPPCFAGWGDLQLPSDGSAVPIPVSSVGTTCLHPANQRPSVADIQRATVLQPGSRYFVTTARVEHRGER